MRKISLVIIVLGLLFLAGARVTPAQEAAEEELTETPATAASEETKAIDAGNKICPVSGEKIDQNSKATYEYEGKIYNFCCPMCIDEFKKDPQKYIKKVEEETKADAQASASEPQPAHQGHAH